MQRSAARSADTCSEPRKSYKWYTPNFIHKLSYLPYINLTPECKMILATNTKSATITIPGWLPGKLGKPVRNHITVLPWGYIGLCSFIYKKLQDLYSTCFTCFSRIVQRRTKMWQQTVCIWQFPLISCPVFTLRPCSFLEDLVTFRTQSELK
jgi:hypothetical protein